jgi:hypothetical protein
MKKLIIFIGLFIIAGELHAQSADASRRPSREEKKEVRKERREQKITLKALEGKDISYQSKEQFGADFGDVQNVQWKRSAYFDEASFTSNEGKSVTAYYDNKSQLVGTTTPSSFRELPVNAQNYIRMNYQNYENAPVVFFDDNEDNETDIFLYGVQLEDADNYFVELKKNGKNVVLEVSPEGSVSYLTEIQQ